jgi:membrane protein implicated in regulation of membrane protease activity
VTGLKKVQKTKQKKVYDTVLRGKALAGLALRAAVAGYIVYLAWKILANMWSGSSAIPEWAVWLICIVFGAAAIGFCIYAWKFFGKAMKAAEMTPVPGPQSGDSGAPARTPEETDDGPED